MKYIKDPMSAFTHFIGVILSIIAVFSLVSKSYIVGSTIHVAAFAIFGSSLILLYLASTLYHIIDRPKGLSNILHRIDHMMIFVLIAGTYTPICLIPLKGTIGLTLLCIIWSTAIAGILFKLFWMNAPRWINTGIYIGMGWMIVIAIFPLAKTLPGTAISWLFAGGIAYTLGAIIYGTKWPKINSKWFGFHEIFHLFVLLGSYCHFVLMYQYVLTF
ncbi:MAG: hemolysin [Firmicutes bacterium HGW-Firmicutes-1]|jgi:hemolysin III|nr:MAG: hemolysin [Firmicutes bacterium HGW-Firmicutes-1]